MPEPEPVGPEDILQTPSVGLNLICGKDHGIRKGSIVLWYGPESSLKSWIALEMCREAQKKWPDKIVAYIDAEYRVDMETATKLVGVNIEPHDTGVPRFVYRRPNSAEEAWTEMGAFFKSGLFSLVVLDSNTALRSTKAVEEADFELDQIGIDARVSSAALRKYAPDIVESGTILWTISQLRTEKKGQHMVDGATGGKAWKFYPTHEFQIKIAEKKPGEEEEILKVFTKKNKFSRSLLTHEIPVVMGRGIDQEADLILTAVGEGFATQKGAYFYYKDTTLGQGLAKASKFIQENPEIKAQILADLYQE